MSTQDFRDVVKRFQEIDERNTLSEHKDIQKEEYYKAALVGNLAEIAKNIKINTNMIEGKFNALIEALERK